MTVPLPPPITMQGTRDTKQDMLTRGHMNHKMSQNLHVGMHVQLYAETGSVCHFFFGRSCNSSAIVVQQYESISGSKYTLSTYHSFFPCQGQD